MGAMTSPQWFEVHVPISRINFHGLKGVESSRFYCSFTQPKNTWHFFSYLSKNVCYGTSKKYITFSRNNKKKTPGYASYLVKKICWVFSSLELKALDRLVQLSLGCLSSSTFFKWFSWSCLTNSCYISCGALKEWGNERLLKWWSVDQDAYLSNLWEGTVIILG